MLTFNDPVGWGSAPTEPAFGGSRDEAASVKGKLVNLISSVRTLMRSECVLLPSLTHHSTRVPMAVEQGGKGERKGKCHGIADSMAVPLIVINTLIIVYALVLG